MTKKITVAFFLLLLGVSFLSAQSLAEASKKEKERRAALKGKQTVVTNEDLGKIKKKAAMTETVPEKPAEEAVAGEAEATVSPEGEQPQAEEAAPGEAPPPAVEAPPAPEAEPTLSQEEFNRRKSELEDASNKAQELVDLLTMKMNGLWQEFYSLDDMTARDTIQQKISETYEKLLKAQQDATKAKDDLDAFIATTPRENVPKIWIR